jgi:predicted NBD/HSP70 family sugar kinase
MAGMYVAIDIGGTKTLLAVLDDAGQILKSQKFQTPSDYTEFLVELGKNYHALEVPNPSGIVAAVPGRLDREKGLVLGYGTLLWKPTPIKADIEKVLGQPVLIENDAKLAGLSEAILIMDEFKKVLYVTISTGISNALIVNGVIDAELANSEGGQILVQDGGSLRQWEDVASGKAIVEKYGKRASELNDPAAWQEISRKLAIGLIDLIAIIQPEVIVFGGGVGSHFDKFQEPLATELHRLETNMTPIPVLRQAQHAEQAVIYGCYELIKQNHAKAA